MCLRNKNSDQRNVRSHCKVPEPRLQVVRVTTTSTTGRLLLCGYGGDIARKDSKAAVTTLSSSVSLIYQAHIFSTGLTFKSASRLRSVSRRVEVRSDTDDDTNRLTGPQCPASRLITTSFDQRQSSDLIRCELAAGGLAALDNVSGRPVQNCASQSSRPSNALCSRWCG